MSRYVLFLAARFLVAAYFLLTSVYGALNCSSFAFDMFIRPQLFPWLGRFVAWHHLWYWAAYLLSLATLARDLDVRRPGQGASRTARILAFGYAGIFGAVGLRLVAVPFLPTLWNDSRALPTALAALAPLAWLAVIDHLGGSQIADAGVEEPTGRTVGQRRALLTCAGTATYLWSAHTVGTAGGWNGVAFLFGAAWTLTLSVTLFAIGYCLVGLRVALASRMPSSRLWDRGLRTVVGAAAICEFLRRLVLPTLSLPPTASWWFAVAVGLTLASTWSGLAARRPRSPVVGNTSRSRLRQGAAAVGGVAALIALPFVASCAITWVAPLDWGFVVQRLILVGEIVLAYTFIGRAAGWFPDTEWSFRGMVTLPALAASALVVLPQAAMKTAEWTGQRQLEPTAAFERQAAADSLFRFLADVLMEQAEFDGEYYRLLQLHADASTATITIPDVTFANGPARRTGRPPDVFLFVIDSLRRDYLSPYNPEATFTPSIERFARESYVFRNAFTRHGATQLASPSIWAGAAVVRKLPAAGFEWMNALERFVNETGYRFAINDYTVAPFLLPSTPVTVIDPESPSVSTDLCQNLTLLQAHLDASRSDRRPVFAYLSPMNVHILNTRRGGQRTLDTEYPGFYSPYASRLRRIDACFGDFVSYLQRRGSYDDSVIVLTSDHGDSLGEGGYWGHGTWLFPEVVRVPLIVHLPASMRSRLTTDLGRIAFTADLAPTFYALAGYPVVAPGAPFGAPLFLAPDRTLPDRRRQSFLVTSSYGAAFGVLRRNGRQLYISDLVARREFAYNLSRGPVGMPVPITPDVRRVGEQEVRKELAALAGFYRFRRDTSPAVEVPSTRPRASLRR